LWVPDELVWYVNNALSKVAYPSKVVLNPPNPIGVGGAETLQTDPCNHLLWPYRNARSVRLYIQ
jgi:hypothetical protein